MSKCVFYAISSINTTDKNENKNGKKCNKSKSMNDKKVTAAEAANKSHLESYSIHLYGVNAVVAC